jgi:hypothetical protein
MNCVLSLPRVGQIFVSQWNFTASGGESAPSLPLRHAPSPNSVRWPGDAPATAGTFPQAIDITGSKAAIVAAAGVKTNANRAI